MSSQSGGEGERVEGTQGGGMGLSTRERHEGGCTRVCKGVGMGEAQGDGIER
jgi:hypothetical protein